MEHSLMTWRRRRELTGEPRVTQYDGVTLSRPLTSNTGATLVVGTGYAHAVLDLDLGTLDLYAHSAEQPGGPTATIRLELAGRLTVSLPPSSGTSGRVLMMDDQITDKTETFPVGELP